MCKGDRLLNQRQALRDISFLQELIDIFNDHELELMISGLPEIDIDDLRANTEYSGYTAASRQIQWCVPLQAYWVTPLVAVSGCNACGAPQLLWPDFAAGLCTLKHSLFGTSKWSHVFFIWACSPAVCNLLRRSLMSPCCLPQQTGCHA